MPKKQMRADSNHPHQKPTKSQNNGYIQEFKAKSPESIRFKGLLECYKVEQAVRQGSHIQSDDLFSERWHVRQQLFQSVAWLVDCAQKYPGLNQTISGFLAEQLQPRYILTAKVVDLLGQLSH